MKQQPRTPAVTLSLLAINMAVAFALVWRPDYAVQFGFDVTRPSVTTAFTSLFLHQNVMHLLGNMIFLAAVGASVELATGGLRFLTVYLLSGLAGVLAHFLLATRGENPAMLLGASGSIAGCAGYYCLRYLRLRVPVAPKFGMSVLAVAGLWLALQIVGAFVKIGDDAGGSAFWSHIGGFLTGLVLSAILRAPDFAQVQLSQEAVAKMNDRSPAAALLAARRHLESHPNDPAALRELANAHRALDHRREEIDALLAWHRAANPELAPIARLSELGALSELPALTRLKLAEQHKVDDQPIAEKLLESIANVDGEKLRPDAILALAEILRNDAPAEAAALGEILTREYPLHPTTELARARGIV